MSSSSTTSALLSGTKKRPRSSEASSPGNGRTRNNSCSAEEQEQDRDEEQVAAAAAAAAAAEVVVYSGCEPQQQQPQPTGPSPTSYSNNGNNTSGSSSSFTITPWYDDSNHHNNIQQQLNQQQQQPAAASVVVVEAVHDTSIVLKGRGYLENVSLSQRRDGTEHCAAAAAAVIEIHGYNLLPTPPPLPSSGSCSIGGGAATAIPFESPPWSAWVTVPLAAGARLKITSFDYYYSNINNANEDGSSSSRSPQQQQQQPLSFAVYSATDREARPTVFPASWQSAADAIVHDYCNRRHAMQEQQQPDKKYSHASFFQESVGDDDDGDEHDPQSANMDGDTTRQHQDETGKSFSGPDKRQMKCADGGFQVVVCGAKGVGKSTCLRYCLNRLLNVVDVGATPAITTTANNSTSGSVGAGALMVAVLDADPGQPEYGVPGMLQLSLVSRPSLVPPHCHLQQHTNNHQQHETHTVIQSHYFGSVTSSSDPVAYLQCVASLVRAYKELLLHIDDNNSKDCYGSGGLMMPLPLLINLDGWIKDLGYEIMTALLQETLDPAHVIQIAGDSISKALDLSQIITAGGDAGGSSSCRLHACWAYNSRRCQNDISAATNNPTNGQGTSQEPQDTSRQQQQQRHLLRSSSSLASYENGDAPLANESTPTMIVPSTSSIPATALRAVRLVTYFMNTTAAADNWNGDSTGTAAATANTIWDRVSVGWQGIDDAAYCEIAASLAAARPYAVSMDAVRVRFTTANDVSVVQDRDIYSQERVWDAINGSIVGLCCHLPKDGDDDENESATSAAALLPCMGLGIVRSIDRVRRLLYILTPCSASSLQSVNVVTVGSNVHLPLECYFRGVHSEAFPYIAFGDAYQSGILGADPMKSRNSISRRGQGGGG